MRNTQVLKRGMPQPRTVKETLIAALGQTSYMTFLLNHAIEACVSDGQGQQALDDIDILIGNVQVLYRSLVDVARRIDQ